MVRFAGEFSVYQSQANNNTTFSFKAIVITSTTTSVLDLTQTKVVQSQVASTFTMDNTISVPAGAKVWIACYCSNSLAGETFTLNTFNLDFKVLKNYTISIIEQSFNDTYNLVTNSNGRVSVVDENAKKTYFPTLIRFGGAYQVNTNLNGLNNFKYENFDEYDRSFGDVMRLHVRDRYLKVYQKFKVGNVPILTQIVKDSANNPLQANTDQLINKIQYYSGDYGIGDASTSLAWNNFADYFVDDYRGVVCRLSQDGITPISITNFTNAFFVAKLAAYRQELNNGVAADGTTTSYTGNPCIYGVFDAYTNKYIIALEEINRYTLDCAYNGGTAVVVTTSTTSTTTTTTAAPVTTTTAAPTTTTSTAPPLPEWYRLQQCYTGTLYWSTEQTADYAHIDDLVYGNVGPTPSSFVVTAVTNQDPGTTQIAIVNSHTQFCPTTTTTLPPTRNAYLIARPTDASNLCNTGFPGGSIATGTAYGEVGIPLVPFETGTLYASPTSGDSTPFNGGGYRWYVVGGDYIYHYSVEISTLGAYSNWVGCSGTKYNQYDVTLVGQGTSGAACTYPSTQTLYAVASQTTGNLVTKFYTDILCTIEFDGNGFYYAWTPSSGGTKYNGIISSLGAVSSVTSC